MSRHEGVSCDSCLKSNFRGRRYKCLICYDYDLCASCYENGATAARHTTDHPMQCILTRSDFDLYYGGEALGLEQPQAYTCPFCNRMGFTDSTLQEHVTTEHSEITQEVVCPVCAAVPGGEPNLLTDDFAGHLTLEHRTVPRDLISFLDEPTAIRHGGVRRIPHSGRGARARRSNMHFSTSGGLSALSPSSRDAVVDPIAELLSQLSGARRVTGSSAQPAAPSQLQQLQMQLQLERQQVSAARQQQQDRVPRRSGGGGTGGASGGGTGGASGQSSSTTAPPATHPPPAHPHAQHLHSQAHAAHATDVSAAAPSQFLLTRFLSGTPSEEERVELEAERARRGSFLRAAVLGSLGRLPPPTPPLRQPTPSPSPAATAAAPLPAPPPLRPASCKTRKQELKPAPPPRAAHPTEGR